MEENASTTMTEDPDTSKPEEEDETYDKYPITIN